MNSRNSKTSDPNRLLLNLSYEIYLKRSDKCYAWKNIKKLYKNKKIQNISSDVEWRIWITDGSYSVSNIWDYFGYIIKNLETVTGNSPIRIYVNKI